MTRHWMGVLLLGALVMLCVGCASEEEIDARCKRDLQVMQASNDASERYYSDISSVLTGLSDDLDRESARTEADNKAAELADAVGDEASAATFSSDAAAHEDRVMAINEMLEAPPPPFPQVASLTSDERDWFVINQCANAARMRRIGLESTLVRKHVKPWLSDDAPDGEADGSTCDAPGSATEGSSSQ